MPRGDGRCDGRGVTTTETLPAPASAPPFARTGVLLIAGAVALAHLVAASAPGLWLDEAYMLAIGRHHLDWGSVDQPPVAPLLAALADALAPGSTVVLRLGAVLATAGAVVVAALVARELGGDRRAQLLTATAQATGLWTSLAGHWLTPYALEPVQWLAIAWLLVRWRRTRDDRLLLALGAVTGVAAQTKFQVLLLAAVLLLAVAAAGPRDLLRRPSLWAGAALGAVLAAPTLLWQAANGWPQLRMGSVVAAEAEVLHGGRGGVAVQLVLFAGLLGAVLGLYGVAVLLRSADLRFLGVTAVVLYVGVVATAGRPYYLVGLHGLLAAAGAVGLQRRREAGRTRFARLRWPAVVLSTAVAGVAVAGSGLLTAPAVPRAITADAVAAHASLPPGERERTAVLGDSYVVAAYLDAAGADLPPAHSLNRGYGWFPPPAEEQTAALHVGGDPGPLRAAFTEVTRVEGTATEIWLLRGRTEPWTDLWPRLRALDVGI